VLAEVRDACALIVEDHARRSETQSGASRVTPMAARYDREDLRTRRD